MMPNISARIKELFTAKKWIAMWMKLWAVQKFTLHSLLICTQKSQLAFNYIDSWIQYLGLQLDLHKAFGALQAPKKCLFSVTSTGGLEERYA